MRKKRRTGTEGGWEGSVRGVRKKKKRGGVLRRVEYTGSGRKELGHKVISKQKSNDFGPLSLYENKKRGKNVKCFPRVVEDKGERPNRVSGLQKIPGFLGGNGWNL